MAYFRLVLLRSGLIVLICLSVASVKSRSAQAQVCTNIAGDWSVSETFTATCSSGGQTQTISNTLPNIVTISQNICTASYSFLVPGSGSFTRIASINGDTVAISGDALTFEFPNPFSGSVFFFENTVNFSGSIQNNSVITLSGSGRARGIVDGVPFDCTTNSQSTFTRLTPPQFAAVIAAVLPTSRAGRVGQTTTALATLVNTGNLTASQCQIGLPPGLPIAFSYQTTDSLTNAPIGAPNTPIDIAPGSAQSFLISLTPGAPMVPTPLTFVFSCQNTPASDIVLGVNTLTFSADTAPVADVVALSATQGGTGIVDVPPTGNGVFGVATVNLGATANISAVVGPRPFTLPVNLGICLTDPQTGACLTTVTSSLPLTLAAGSTSSFAVFVGGNGQAIGLAPGTNRIAIDFIDGTGTIRGGTSVAVRTN